MRLLVVSALVLAGLVPLVFPPTAVDSVGRSSRHGEASSSTGTLIREVTGTVGISDFACSTSLTAITPCTAGQAVGTNVSGAYTFTVQNKTIEPNSYGLTCGKSGTVTTCSVPGSVTINPNSSKTVSVSWSTGASAGTGTLSLTADDGSAPVTGVVTFTVTAPVATPWFVAQVSPHLQRHLVDSGQVDTARFVLRNAGEDSSGWSWSAACTGAAISAGSCSSTSGTVGLQAGVQTTIAVAYTTTGAANALGQVLLTQWRTSDATVRDSGFIEVQVARNDSLVQVSQQNAGELVEPSQCITVSVARGLAAECGALRAVHVLPFVRTMGKVRAPVLIYNSQQAHPRPVIRADVTTPDARSPDSVTAVLKDSSGNAIGGATGSWAGSQWRARSTRRIAVSFDAIGWPSGIHRYTLDVRRWYGASPELLSVTGAHWVVNRSASVYGAGWWVAGLERLQNPDGSLRVTHGDGGTRRYFWVAANTYVAASLDRPDTVVLVGTSYWERRAPRGLRVRYDYSTGLHVSTVNRLGHVTRFTYVAGTERLDSIVPPSGSQLVAWKFQYDNTPSLLQVQVVGSGLSNRRDSLVMTNGDLTKIVQRDTRTILFGYDGSEAHRLVTRTDERGVTDTVAYGTASAVNRVSVQSNLTNAAVRDTLKLVVAETRGLPGTAARLDASSTIVDGFRTDVPDTTAYLVNRWGAPTRVRNALGDESQLARTSGSFPALVTYLRMPNRRAVAATYDGRGNLATVLDSATFRAGPTYAQTSYQWNQSFDAIMRIINPEGDSAKTGIDGTNGNILWSEDGRGSSTRTNFLYDATTGQLIRSLTATGVKDSLTYDAAIRNPASRRNVLGQIEAWTQDGAGRVVRTQRTVAAGVVKSDTLLLDAMDRDTLALSRSPTDTLVLRKVFTAAGQLQRVERKSAHDSTLTRAKVGTIATAFVYDARNRVGTESLPGYYALATTYDAAGNVTAGGRNPWATTFDALNRPVLRVATDINRVVYDEVGQLRAASNANARVARTWGSNGTLVTDQLWIASRRVADRNFSVNVFAIGARYDLNLRRVAFRHPSTVAPVGADSQRTWFNAGSGLMDSVADIFGNKFTFQYDGDARPARVVRLANLAGAMVESLTYDSVGRLRTRMQRAGVTILHGDTLTYDVADRITRAAGANDGAAYNVLGPLDSIWYGASGIESYKTDALGLRYSAFGSASFFGSQSSVYLPNSERLSIVAIPSQTPTLISGDTTAYSYTTYGMRGDEARRKWFFASGSCNPLCPPAFNMREVRTNSAAWDGSWRPASVSFHLDTIPVPGSSYRQYNRVETYRYDPLGRRIRKEMIRDTSLGVCTTHDKSSGCKNDVTRTVWDGANILYDIRMAADTGNPTGGDGYPSAGTLTGSVGYTNAGGIDAPLDLFKGYTVVVPYTTWRGTFDMGTCPTTKCTDADAYFPLQNATAFDDAAPPANGPLNWFGEVIGGQTDGSGYQYKRNRSYDARSGLFTQEDPIGQSGGLNAYGFAGGDPVSFSDPFGLCKTYEGKKDANCVHLVAQLRRAAAELAKALGPGERNVFAEAADAFDSTNRAVVYVAWDDDDLNATPPRNKSATDGPNLGVTPSFGTTIKIGKFLGPVDRLAVAMHEILVHGKSGGLGAFDDLPPPYGTASATNRTIWSQLTNSQRNQAVRFRGMEGVP